MGVLPTLRAAFDLDARQRDHYGTSKFFEMHGNPIRVKSNKRSHDEKAAHKLWELSKKLTEVKY